MFIDKVLLTFDYGTRVGSKVYKAQNLAFWVIYIVKFRLHGPFGKG